MKCANPTTNAHVVLPLGFTNLVNLLSLTANAVVALRLVFTNLVNLLSLFQLLVRAFVKVNQLGLVVDGGGTLGACHPPRLPVGAFLQHRLPCGGGGDDMRQGSLPLILS
jgi:hypothetical protein